MQIFIIYKFVIYFHDFQIHIIYKFVVVILAWIIYLLL